MIPFYKRLGETPLEALNRLKKEQPDLATETLSYAGRLDPMAEGLLLVLVGGENNEREKYLSLPKIYSAEMLLGIETDSNDLLGKITHLNKDLVTISPEKIKEIIGQYIGTFTQEYPPFSSKPVQGKPLFAWAREGKLKDITIPSHEVTVYECTIQKITTISSENLLKTLKNKVNLVKGDFRQEEILASWHDELSLVNREWQLVQIELSCSSGTYVRAIIHDIGKQLKMCATTFSIVRKKIGDFSL